MDRFKLILPAVRRGVIVSLTFVCTSGLWGCTESKDAYAHQRFPHAALIDGFESYISAAEARRRLPSGLPVRVLFEWKMTAGDRRPRFDELTLRVSGFEHVGVKGDLDLEFVNDRLVRTMFSLPNCSAYLQALRPAGARVSENRWRSGFTEVWTLTSQDSKRGACAAWGDVRLSEEAQRWVAQYS